MVIEIQPGSTILAKLIDAAHSGEEVVLASAGRPLLKLVAVPFAPQTVSRVPGRLKGKLHLPADWTEKFDEMDEEIASMMLDAPLTTDGDI